MSEPITYWKWARDGMVVAACPEIQDGLYIIRERYDALHAKVRELEGRLAAREKIYLRDQARIHDLEDKLRQVEEERDQLRAALQALSKDVECYCADFPLHERICPVHQAKRALEGKEEHGTKSNA